MDAASWTSEARTSQLCKPLSAILRDTSPFSMLEYFIQYMESVGGLHLVQFWLSVESFKLAGQGASLSRDCMPSPLDEVESCDITGCGNIVVSAGAHTLGKATYNSQPLGASRSEMSAVYRTEHTTTPSEHPNAVVSYKEHFITSQSLGVSIHPENDNSCIYSNRSLQESGSMSKSECHSHGTACCVVPTVGSQPSITPQSVEKRLSKHKSLTIVNDALGIYTTYIALNALSPVDIPDEMRQRVEVSICPEDGVVDRSCFSEAQEFIFESMRNRYYPRFLQSSILCKFQLEYISSGKLKLLDFILGDNTLFYFMEYMERENASSLLQFWLTSENFVVQLSNPSHTSDTKADMADAIAIYERYFSLQAHQHLGMEDSVRLDVENKICDEHGPRVDSFAAPQQIAYDIMNETYYPNFLESSIYLQFLNELLHMVKDSPQPSIASETDAVCDHESELEQDLDDPESLWKRPIQLPLRLGYVDDFGQYISEVDPIPLKPRDKGKKGFFWQRIQRFRNRKQEEELAMKISRKIITEVLEPLYSCS